MLKRIDRLFVGLVRCDFHLSIGRLIDQSITKILKATTTVPPPLPIAATMLKVLTVSRPVCLPAGHVCDGMAQGTRVPRTDLWCRCFRYCRCLAFFHMRGLNGSISGFTPLFVHLGVGTVTGRCAAVRCGRCWCFLFVCEVWVWTAILRIADVCLDGCTPGFPLFPSSLLSSLYVTSRRPLLHRSTEARESELMNVN